MKLNLNSIILSTIYGVILFGPHRVFGFNYLQELLTFILFLLYLNKGKLNKIFIFTFILIFSYYAIKVLQISYVGYYDFLIYGSIPLFIIKIGAGLFIIREKITKLAHLIIFPLLLCLTNSILIFLKFIFPQLRTLGLENLQNIPVGAISRYNGIAFDGFQITTIISCFLLLYLIIYNSILKNIINFKKDINYILLISILIVVIGTSWLFQGRASQFISTVLIFILPLFAYFSTQEKVLKFSFNLQKSKLKILTPILLFFSSLITSFSAILVLKRDSPFLKPLEHAFELYRSMTDIESIKTITELAGDKNLFDLSLNLPQLLIGNVFSGRNSVFKDYLNVDMDNGYFLAIFKFGFLGTLILYLSSLLPLLPLFKKSKLSLILVLVFLALHYKESTYFSGASYLAIFWVAKLEFISQSLIAKN